MRCCLSLTVCGTCALVLSMYLEAEAPNAAAACFVDALSTADCTTAHLDCDVGEMHPVLSITLEIHPQVALKAAHAHLSQMERRYMQSSLGPRLMLMSQNHAMPSEGCSRCLCLTSGGV